MTIVAYYISLALEIELDKGDTDRDNACQPDALMSSLDGTRSGNYWVMNS